jgi:peptide/nickel transport system substrate-binding protein
MSHLLGRGLLVGCLAVSTVNFALADELKIGFKSELTSADPHVLNGANRNIWNHVYDSLVETDANLRPRPGLALSWRLVNPTTWEFKLRPNVKFQNGATMTADDVKYSIERAMNLSGPRTYRSYLRDVESVSVSGPLTVQVKAKSVSPTLPENLGLVAIIPKSLGENLTEESFATGKSAIGTGPYKYVSWKHGENVVLAKNADYWGDKEPWDKVTLHFIPREPARAAALISGGVDIINDVPSNQEASLKAFKLTSVTSYMLNYLLLDQFRDNSPYVKAVDGAALPRNPLKDLKVRQAMASAINRDGIIKFLMKGDATASEQLVPKGFFGYDPALKGLPYDLSKAKALLAEAGYPNGFKLTMHCPNNRYVNDAKLCEAIAQVFNQIGIKADVSTMPFAVFQTRLVGGGANGDPEFSVALLGTGAVTGDSSTLLASMIRTYGKGAGANNYGRFSNKDVDAVIAKAAATNDEKERLELQKRATKMALDDQAVIPLQHLNVSWAMKKELSIVPRADGFTMATEIRKK